MHSAALKGAALQAHVLRRARRATQGSQTTTVSAVVVSFNSGAWLARALNSWLTVRSPDGSPLIAEILVVDNASSDGSLDALSQLPEAARIRIIQLPENIGFAAAANRGWRASQYANVLFINPDCEYQSGDATGLITALADPRNGVVSCVLRNSDGSIQAPSLRRDPTPLRAVVHASKLGRWLPGLAVNIPFEPKRHSQGVAVDACSGALMLMRRSTLQQLDGFDEGYFLHCEDLDLCRRVRAVGLRVWVLGAPQVMHAKGTSSEAVPALVARAKYHGMLRYFEKFDAATTPAWLAWLLRKGASLQLKRSLRGR